MSKAKNVGLCLPVMVVMGGKSYPAGTPVPMDAATAKEMRARYREVPESRAEKQPKRPVKPTGEALTKAIPMRRLAQPDDYPGMVAFFLSDDASFITGQTISVSGGLSMHG